MKNDQEALRIGITLTIVAAFVIVLSICFICKRNSESKISFTYTSMSTSTANINIGSKYNEWREPVFEVGPEDDDIREYFKQRGLDVNQSDWRDSCMIVNKIVTAIAREMKNLANIHFPGLIIDDTFIKQGSSREGLKVCESLEFDFIIPFCIEGLNTQRTDVYNRDGNVLPGFFIETVINAYNTPSWMRRHSILEGGGYETYKINTSKFQTKVFTSLLDKSMDKINKQLQKMTTSTKSYRIVRSVKAPNLKITIEVRSPSGLKDLLMKRALQSSENVVLQTLEADLVPAICLSSDTVPDPYTVHNFHQSFKHRSTSSQVKLMSCVRYGVMKWVNESNQFIPVNNRDILWRNSTCGYEKHILDVARRNLSQRYVMTACRLLKGALYNFNRKSHGDSQLDSVIKSYHLKNICLYCILFLTIPSKEKKLSGVKEALGYFIKYLQLILMQNCYHISFMEILTLN